MQVQEIHNLAETFADGWMHSAPKPLEVPVSPECNKTDIDWYERKPKDPSPIDPKVGKLLKQYEEEEENLGLTFPMKESWLPNSNR